MVQLFYRHCQSVELEARQLQGKPPKEWHHHLSRLGLEDGLPYSLGLEEQSPR